MATAADLALANRLADAAGEAIRPLFRGEWSQERKPDQSFVTEADRAAEAAMRAILESERADDGIIGEEYGTRNEGAARQWVGQIGVAAQLRRRRPPLRVVVEALGQQRLERLAQVARNVRSERRPRARRLLGVAESGVGNRRHAGGQVDGGGG